MPPSRRWQILLIVATVAFSWLAMQGVHELGHALHAWIRGGGVQRVVWHPLAISRTDVAPNPHPLFVAAGGAVWGTLVLLVAVRIGCPPLRYLAAFFAGFCCLANGLYLAAGAFYPVGDAADLLRLGAARWQLAAVGTPLAILGIWLWHGLGADFGIGPAPQPIRPGHALGVSAALMVLVVLLLVLSPPA